MPKNLPVSVLISLLVLVLGLSGFVLTVTIKRHWTQLSNGASSFTQTWQSFPQLEKQWVVSGNQAQELIAQGAILLDARSCNLFPCSHQFNAISIRWQDFSPAESSLRGNLLADEQILTAKLQAMGIDIDKPVVVIGNPQKGWGEEGRIVWMLRTLGHPQVALVDGGYQALLASQKTFQEQIVASKTQKHGNFIVKRRDDWLIEREQLQASWRENQTHLAIIDTRSQREYLGATPYGESRGGHIPGAIHLHYRELLDQEGKLLTREQIMTKLEELGVSSEHLIVSYCTGGVRSGWLTAILVDLGFMAKNYAGSMWEWSESPQTDYLLEKF